MNPIIALTVAALQLPGAGIAGAQPMSDRAGPDTVPAQTARAASAQAVDSLTVTQAIQRVLATHPAIQEATNGVSAAEARVQESRTAFSPVVVADGAYSRIGPTPTLTFNNMTFSLFPANNYDASLTLRHTLFDWGRRSAAVSVARASQKTAAENVQLVKSRLAFQAVDAFYGVYFLEQSLKVQDDEIAALTQHLEIAKNKVQAGTATSYDVLSTQVRIATARSQRVDVAEALEQRTIELRQLMGLPAGRAIHPVGGLPEDTAAPDVDSLTTAALSQRPDVRLSRDAEAAARVRTRLAALADRPSLGLDLSVGAKNGYVPNINRIEPDFVAGVSIQLPVYNGHRTRSQVNASRAEADVAHSRTAALELSVKADVEKAAAAVRASLDKIRTADVQVRQATAAVALAQTRYQAGVVTNLDILDAQTLLAEARLVQLRARYELVRSRYMLQQAVGDRIW